MCNLSDAIVEEAIKEKIIELKQKDMEIEQKDAIIKAKYDEIEQLKAKIAALQK